MTRAAKYHAFGVPNGTSTFEPQLGYRGEVHTDALVYLRARDYQPATGTFTTTDPIDGVDGTTTVANPYAYANNDPINRSDPSGMFAIGDGAFDEGDLLLTTSFQDGAPCIPTMDASGNILVYNARTGHCGYWFADCGTAPLGGFGAFVCEHSTGIIQIAGVVAVTALVVAGGIVAAPYIAAGAASAQAYFNRLSAWCATNPTCQRTVDQLTRNAPSEGGQTPRLTAEPNFENPGVAPGPGWEWRGAGAPGSEKGNWYRPSTGESLYPDLSHPDPIGVHYDWKAPDGTTYRVYRDGRVVPK